MSCFSGNCKSCSLVLPCLACASVCACIHHKQYLSPKSPFFEAHQHVHPCHQDYFYASADWLCFFHNFSEFHADPAVPPATLFDELATSVPMLTMLTSKPKTMLGIGLL